MRQSYINEVQLVIDLLLTSVNKIQYINRLLNILEREEEVDRPAFD